MPTTSESRPAVIQTSCPSSSAPCIVNTSLHRKGQENVVANVGGLGSPDLNALPLSTPDMHLVQPGAATLGRDT